MPHSPFPLGRLGAKKVWISSYRIRTSEAPTPLKVLDRAPLKKALVPSFWLILRKQSIVLVYMTSD